MKKIDIYTDGACSGNPGKGGLGVVVIDDYNQVATLKEGFRHTTNNRMEILAAIRAIETVRNYILDNGIDTRETDIKVTVLTDSQLVVNTMKPKDPWSKKANKDLWERLDQAVNRLEYYTAELPTHIKVSFEKVKGHADDTYNKLADELAVQARRDPLFIDEIYENIAATNNTHRYKDEDELAWYVEEEFTDDIQEGFLSEESYKMAKQMVKDHYYIPHGPRKHAMELGDEGFRDFLQLVRKGADPYDALDQAEANAERRFKAAKEPEIVNISLIGQNTPEERRIEILLSNGTTVKVIPCHGGFEQTSCTQREAAVTNDIAWRFVGWLNGWCDF